MRLLEITMDLNEDQSMPVNLRWNGPRATMPALIAIHAVITTLNTWMADVIRKDSGAHVQGQPPVRFQEGDAKSGGEMN